MTSRIDLITILLVCFNADAARAAFDWESECQISIPENTPKESLYTITAPEETNAAYTYGIGSESDTDRFSIDTNGVLSSDTDLDFESGDNSYSVQFSATRIDNDDSKNGDVTCKIEVTDVNDVEPVFFMKSYNVDTVNNVTKNTSVVTVSATDGDVSAEFNNIVYSIKAGGDGGDFIIAPETGVISANTLLTAKVPPTLKLTVIASDTKFTTEANVTVCVGCKRSGSTTPGISLFAPMALVLSILLM